MPGLVFIGSTAFFKRISMEFRSHNRVEDAEKASHAGDERDLLWTPPFDQAFVMFADDRVPPNRGECRHVESIAHVGPATSETAALLVLSKKLAAVFHRDEDA